MSGRSFGSGRRGGVELWRVDFDGSDVAVTAACSLLSGKERERAGRGSPAVRRRRVLSRASLRTVLGSYTGLRPEALEFGRGAFGKPTLASNAAAPGLHFNLTTSGDCCLIAVTRIGPVGVDVERVSPSPDVDRVARRFFAPGEAAAIGRLRGEAKLTSFYNCWTRSEAYLKARGHGLSRGFGGFVVSVEEGEAPAILALDDDDPGAWTLVSLRPDPDLVGALALRTGGGPSGPLGVRELSLSPLELA